jgi:protein-tyrosine phosphatase
MWNTTLWTWLNEQLNRQSAGPTAACFWKTDIHSHLIPGIDDGVRTTAQSVECLKKLADWGIQKVITTPHIGHYNYQNQESAIIAGCEELRQQAAQAGLSIQIEVAAEYMLDEFFLARLAQQELLSFGPKRYLLVETSLVAPQMQLPEMIFQIQTKGYTPVLAHPERYAYYEDDGHALLDLRAQGCLFQLNWLSLVGRYGAGAEAKAKLLLKNKWVDFVGSDLHRPADLAALQTLFSLHIFKLLHQQPLQNQLL